MWNSSENFSVAFVINASDPIKHFIWSWKVQIPYKKENRSEENCQLFFCSQQGRGHFQTHSQCVNCFIASYLRCFWWMIIRFRVVIDPRRGKWYMGNGVFDKIAHLPKLIPSRTLIGNLSPIRLRRAANQCWRHYQVLSCKRNIKLNFQDKKSSKDPIFGGKT